MPLQATKPRFYFICAFLADFLLGVNNLRYLNSHHKVYKYSYILLYLLQIYESSYIMSVQVITILPESGPSIIVLSESGP